MLMTILKKGFFIQFLFLYQLSFAQVDSIIIKSGDPIKRKLSRVMVLNGILISDTIKADLILKNFSNEIYIKRFYSGSKGYKKWGIVSRDGILFYKIKSEYIFDITEMKMIRREN